jgi:multiple sugar transport system permease protein
MQVEQHSPPSTQLLLSSQRGWRDRMYAKAERLAGSAFILPAVLVVLLLAIFPLIISLYLSLSRFKFVRGGFQINFVGLANYKKLLFGLEKTHFLGLLGHPSLLGWMIFIAVAGLLLYTLVRNLRSGAANVRGIVGSLLSSALVLMIVWLLVATLGKGGRPGTLIVTLLYVFIGIFFQYTHRAGVGCSPATTSVVASWVIFLLPMMITPVGIAYTFLMLVDTDKGPVKPILQALGLGLFSWVNDPWLARAAIMLGDVWHWTPFMFIVLLAALEGQSVELVEAAKVDGANRWQIFWYITLPQILPVSTTLVLIRMIESFKIVDLPNVLTNGGPGTATESLTLQAFFSWRALDLGGSAAIAYSLLFLVTFIGISYVNLVRRRVVEV